MVCFKGIKLGAVILRVSFQDSAVFHADACARGCGDADADTCTPESAEEKHCGEITGSGVENKEGAVRNDSPGFRFIAQSDNC